MAGTEQPQVVAVIPAYNSVGFIEKSIVSLLQQDYPFSRKIVLDDCSSDGTYEFVTSRYADSLEIVRNERNCGFSYSLNRAVSLAGSADFLFILEDDIELVDRDYIARAVKHFANPRVAAVCGQAVDFDRQRLSFAKRCFSRYINADHQETGVHEVSYSLLKSDLFRISALRKAGPFGFAGSSKLGIEDQIFARKLREHGFIILKDASVRYRLDFARQSGLGGLLKSEAHAGRTLGVSIARGLISVGQSSGSENQRKLGHRSRQVVFTAFVLASFLLVIFSARLAGITILSLLVIEFLAYMVLDSSGFHRGEKLYFAALGVVNDFAFSIPFYIGVVCGFGERVLLSRSHTDRQQMGGGVSDPSH